MIKKNWYIKLTYLDFYKYATMKNIIKRRNLKVAKNRKNRKKCNLLFWKIIQNAKGVTNLMPKRDL